MHKNKIKIFLVDDDELYLNMLKIELQQNEAFIIETFITGELCLADLSKKPDVIVLDYYLDGLDKNAKDGIQVLDEIKVINPSIPVVMLSA